MRIFSSPVRPLGSPHFIYTQVYVRCTCSSALVYVSDICLLYTGKSKICLYTCISEICKFLHMCVRYMFVHMYASDVYLHTNISDNKCLHACTYVSCLYTCVSDIYVYTVHMYEMCRTYFCKCVCVRFISVHLCMYHIYVGVYICTVCAR